MDKILKLGGKEFKVEINFKKSYELTKYRNKISVGFDFGEADKEIVAEILKISEMKNKNEEIDMSILSPEALRFLQGQSTKTLLPNALRHSFAAASGRNTTLAQPALINLE